MPRGGGHSLAGSIWGWPMNIAVALSNSFTDLAARIKIEHEATAAAMQRGARRRIIPQPKGGNHTMMKLARASACTGTGRTDKSAGRVRRWRQI